MSDDRGFSLIELVVALSIAALIATLLFGGYSFASRAWNRTTAASENTAEIYAAQSLLRRAVGSMSATPKLAALSGGEANLNFAGSFAMPGEAETPAQIVLAPGPCPEGQCLYLGIGRDEAKQNAAPFQAPLIRNIESVSIAYRERGKSAAWTDHWSDEREAPQLIRIDLRFPAGDKRRWPSLYLSPQ